MSVYSGGASLASLRSARSAPVCIADGMFIFMFVYIGVYLHDVLGVDNFNICSNHFVRFVWAMFSASVTPAYYLLRPGDCDCTWFGLFCVLHPIVN